eukprot:14865799-Ditylum_brightwellii.AAC.1
MAQPLRCNGYNHKQDLSKRPHGQSKSSLSYEKILNGNSCDQNEVIRDDMVESKIGRCNDSEFFTSHYEQRRAQR